MTTDFREIQRFDQNWLWGLLILSLMVLIGLFGYGLYQQLILDQPWGDRPISDQALVLVSVGLSLFIGSMIYLFRILRLEIEVGTEGIYVRFYPLRSNTIPYQKVKSCEARRYKPLGEYGGWGIKYGRSGWAYNVRGDWGVQLVLTDGKRILLGSQRADVLASEIKRHCHRG